MYVMVDITYLYSIGKTIVNWGTINVITLNVKQQIQIKEVDIRDYAKFILKDGSIEEKRELLTCFKSRIILSNKIISLQ